MHVNVFHATHPDMVPGLSTEQLRSHYLLTDLFTPGDIRLNYSHQERLMVGGASPAKEPLRLEAVKQVAADSFLARREIGIVNIGGSGRVVVDKQAFDLRSRDGLYIGMGSKDVTFESAEAGRPARFYLVSAPAHARFETRKISVEEARPAKMGSKATCNERTIYQYINPEVCKSSQLLLGLTALETGSVWNTMPCHLHDRRSEVYFYFDLEPEARIFHFMGQPTRTRHLVVASEQAVVSPPWSIHMGAGTSRYAFIWAMAGENQDYKDMEIVPTPTLL